MSHYDASLKIRNIASDIIYIMVILLHYILMVKQLIIYMKEKYQILEIITNNMNLSFILGYTGYFFTVYYLNKYELSLNIKKTIYSIAIISLLFAIFGTGFLSVKLGESYTELYGNLLPNTFFVSSAVFIFIKDTISEKKISKFTLTIINQISSASLGIYMVHALYIGIFLEIGISTLKFNPIISIHIITILVFICSYITVYIMSKIWFFRKYI